MTASLTWWRKALEGACGLLPDPHPQPGFYRTASSECESSHPVAIFDTADGMKALRARRPVAPAEVWASCHKTPISRETYIPVAERGEPWPEQTRAVVRVTPVPSELQTRPAEHPVSSVSQGPRAQVHEGPRGFAVRSRPRSGHRRAEASYRHAAPRPACAPVRTVARAPSSAASARSGEGQTLRIGRSPPLLPRR